MLVWVLLSEKIKDLLILENFVLVSDFYLAKYFKDLLFFILHKC